MKLRYALLAALTLVITLSNAHAQAKFEGGPTKGARTTSVSGDLVYTSGSNYNGTGRIELGYYTTDQIEVAGVIAANFQGSPPQTLAVTGGGTANQNASSSSGIALGVDVKYHIGRGRVIPYVGIAPQYDVINLTGHKSDQLIVIGTGGADFFVTPQQSFFAELSAERFTKDGTTSGRLDLGVKLFY